ncbi:hypothetical protein BJ138DRAFT_1155983, partial [Hygrophoropsis aurantiaca]
YESKRIKWVRRTLYRTHHPHPHCHRRVKLTRMVAFAPVFALFIFFAVANTATLGDVPGIPVPETCKERMTNIKKGTVLQLFTHDDCVTKEEGDYQIISDRLESGCVCRAVDESIGDKIASMAFETGEKSDAVFMLFKGEHCFSEGYGPLPFPGEEGPKVVMLKYPVPDDVRITFAQICSSPEMRKKAEKAHLIAERARHRAIVAKYAHEKGWLDWEAFEHVAEDVKHGVAGLAADVGVTKTGVEKGLAAVGIGAASIGVLQAFGGVVAVLA